MKNSYKSLSIAAVLSLICTLAIEVDGTSQVTPIEGMSRISVGTACSTDNVKIVPKCDKDGQVCMLYLPPPLMFYCHTSQYATCDAYAEVVAAPGETAECNGSEWDFCPAASRSKLHCHKEKDEEGNTTSCHAVLPQMWDPCPAGGFAWAVEC